MDEDGRLRVILIDVDDASREVMSRRLRAQGYSVQPAPDPATGADMALAEPPAALIADLWMPSISGVQLCRLLRAEPATADTPVLLRGPNDDRRSHFWAERAGATAYVVKGRMGELVRSLAKAVHGAPSAEPFFMQLSGGSVDIRDRIARHLDAALFESVIASEVRALGSAGSLERVFDTFCQFLSQVINYRWMAVATTNPEYFAVHHHPHDAGGEAEARTALNVSARSQVLRVADEDAQFEVETSSPLIFPVQFGGAPAGKLALSPSAKSEPDTATLLELVARELGGPIRMAALMEESRRLATEDSLTGLMNRRAFLAMMRIELARSARYDLPLSVLLLDVDHFKSINDTYGHAAGDQVLAAVGSHLRCDLRLPDSAARWGGEEFIVALKNTDLDGATVVAERMVRSIAALEIPIPGFTMRATVSVGVTSLRAGESTEDLVARADRAMYAAKAAGRNRFMVTPRQNNAPARDLPPTSDSADSAEMPS